MWTKQYRFQLTETYTTPDAEKRLRSQVTVDVSYEQLVDLMVERTRQKLELTLKNSHSQAPQMDELSPFYLLTEDVCAVSRYQVLRANRLIEYSVHLMTQQQLALIQQSNPAQRWYKDSSSGMPDVLPPPTKPEDDDDEEQS